MSIGSHKTIMEFHPIVGTEKYSDTCCSEYEAQLLYV